MPERKKATSRTSRRWRYGARVARDEATAVADIGGRRAYNGADVRGLLLGLLLGALAACAGAVQPTATPRTALEQRLAQGAGVRPSSPTPVPTLEPVTPEATWTPAPFGRRATPTAIAPLNARPAEVVRLE